MHARFSHDDRAGRMIAARVSRASKTFSRKTSRVSYCLYSTCLPPALPLCMSVCTYVRMYVRMYVCSRLADCMREEFSSFLRSSSSFSRLTGKRSKRKRRSQIRMRLNSLRFACLADCSLPELAELSWAELSWAEIPLKENNLAKHAGRQDSYLARPAKPSQFTLNKIHI